MGWLVESIRVLMWVVSLLFVFLFITVPSILYNLITFVMVLLLLPVSFILSLVFGKSSYYQAGKIALSLSTPALILGVPFLLQLYVSQLLGWIFFGWMLIYFVSRRFTGAHERDARMARAGEELYALQQKYKIENK